MLDKKDLHKKVESFSSRGLRKLTGLGMKFEGKKLFKKGLDVGLRAITSEISKKLISKGIKHAPGLYKIGTSKIKNKNMKKALESDVPNYVVEETQKRPEK